MLRLVKQDSFLISLNPVLFTTKSGVQQGLVSSRYEQQVSMTMKPIINSYCLLLETPNTENTAPVSENLINMNNKIHLSLYYFLPPWLNLL